MAWFKVDDKLFGHPKWLATPPRARGLWVTAGSWCAASGTDGRVPRESLRSLGGTPTDAAALVSVGLWREVKAGWIFHEWSIYQPDAASEKAKRKADSDAGTLGNHKRWHEKRRIFVPECEYCQGMPPDGDEPPRDDDESYRPPDRVPDRTPDVFSIGSASPVPVPDTHSDSQVGGGGSVSNASEPPPPPTPEILDNLAEPWRCPNHQGINEPCNHCKRYKAANKALEAQRAKDAKAAVRDADKQARLEREAERAATKPATAEEVKAALAKAGIAKGGAK